MDPFALGLLTLPVRSVKLSPEAYLHTDNHLVPHFLEELEFQLEQAKEKTLLLRAQEQQREKPVQYETKQVTSESRYWTNEERQRFEKALKTLWAPEAQHKSERMLRSTMQSLSETTNVLERPKPAQKIQKLL
ncbi:hypothetical protein KP509_01G018800 [Ceratopteris richardii]|uniref:Uncharacterized protein n=1 Tax=Ceratopteris richardii TaxID=49495 RepID=A0A8T2VHS1_CERRI|nr:hypothetical protein KP509_01G018800 [Ceratopteris richardii]